MSCAENIDRFACRKEWSTHALTLPCAHQTFCYAECIEENHLTLCLRDVFFLWNLFVACVSAYAGSFLKGKWCKGRRSCGWSGSTRRASGTTATKSGEFASTLFAKRLGLCRKFFCRGCTNKSGKYWGHLKLPTTKCTPKDRSSSQGSQDEIHKPCFLLKIGSPILPKHPATWHEVGHPSGQDMAWFEQFACLQVLLVLRLSFFQTNFQTYYIQIASCWIIVSQHRLHTRLRSTTFPWCGKLCAWHASYLRIKASILIPGARNGLLVTKQFKLVVVLRSHHIVNTLHGHFWARIKFPRAVVRSLMASLD